MIAVVQNSALPRQAAEQGQIPLVLFGPSHLLAAAGHCSAHPRKEGIAEQNRVHSILPAAETIGPNHLAVAVDPNHLAVVAGSTHCWLVCLTDSMVPVDPALHSRPPSLLPR